jgi:PAS domain-containing protein
VLVRPADPAQPPRLLSPRERAVAALLTACELLTRRGPDRQGWATPFCQDPVAFLLDTVSDAVNIWGPDGVIVYSNRAAEEIDIGDCTESAPKEFVHAGRHFERRCSRVEYQSVEYVLEVLHQVAH